MQPEDDEEVVKRKSSSVYTYDKWWRSPAICIFIVYWFYLSKTLIVIYLFKLLRLLQRIDPLQTKPESRRKIDTIGTPPIGVPSWCLNQDALERFNHSNVNVPVYDQDTDSVQDESDNDIGYENRTNRTNSSKKKRKSKKKSKKKIRNIKNNSIFFFYVTLLDYIIN